MDSAHQRHGAGGGEDLVEAARGGDRRALEQLLVRHHDRVYALCRRMLGHDPDAQDATQDTLLAVVRSLSRFDGRSSFGTWIYRVAVNTCLDELRRRRKRPLLAVVELDGAGEHASLCTNHGGDVADTAVARIDVDGALGRLAPEFRAAVVLRDLCDLSYEEIARVLDVPVGTVRSRISRGRATLADLLGNFSGPPGVETVEVETVEDMPRQL